MLYITALRNWREEDHEDSITLSRHEVIILLEEILLLEASK